MNDNAISFVGKVLDNVHGFIWYTSAEEKIMDTLLFKRLQSIKQLSLVNWVFPGSEHTRFIHSLGVMHIADRIAQVLSLTSYQRRIVRLAGLLHDIGHYPLSHVCEFPYKKKMVHYSDKEFLQSWNADTCARVNAYSFTPETEFMKNSKNGHHEEIGALIIRNSDEIKKIITDECGDDEAIEIICDMITGNIRENSTNELLVQILHSELDADGIDYLLRDAMFSGTSFGSFELDQLIGSLSCCEINDHKILCITPKGIAAADQYLLNKFFSYSQVVFNKHTIILEWMAEQVVSWMQENDAYFPARETLRTQWVKATGYEDLLSFTDDFFWHSLRNMCNNPVHNALPSHIMLLCKALLNHQECIFVDGSEIKLIASNNTMFDSNKMNLLAGDGEILLFSERSMTKHVPKEVFISNIKKPDDDDSGDSTGQDFDDYRDNLLYYRLLEGISIDDQPGDPHLLCDDKRSLMQQLYNSRLLIIRKYRMPH